MNRSTAEIRAAFKRRLSEPGIIVAPGVYDAISALLAEQAGFECVFFSGSAMATTQLAMPDIGLLTLPEIASAVQRAADRIDTPIVVDVDQGFGGAAQAARTMKTFERAGAAAIQVEDQQLVKPSNALTSRPLIPVQDMLGKIKAMLDARESEHMLLSARTDAKDPQEAVDRCLAFRDAGADIVFPEGMTDIPALIQLREALDDDAAMVYNNHYEQSEILTAADAEKIGADVVLFPVLAVRSAIAAMQTAFAAMAADPDLRGAGNSPLTNEQQGEVTASREIISRLESI
ncbi:MAG: oxaloacetate decarboxylase [Congregibacter sp.]